MEPTDLAKRRSQRASEGLWRLGSWALGELLATHSSEFLIRTTTEEKLPGYGRFDTATLTARFPSDLVFAVAGARRRRATAWRRLLSQRKVRPRSTGRPVRWRVRSTAARPGCSAAHRARSRRAATPGWVPDVSRRHPARPSGRMTPVCSGPRKASSSG
jgi:hypothetical protein